MERGFLLALGLSAAVTGVIGGFYFKIEGGETVGAYGVVIRLLGWYCIAFTSFFIFHALCEKIFGDDFIEKNEYLLSPAIVFPASLPFMFLSSIIFDDGVLCIYDFCF